MNHSKSFWIFPTFLLLAATVHFVDSVSFDDFRKFVSSCVKSKCGMSTNDTRRKWSDPELNMTLEQIVEHWGFPIQTHPVHTKDGYILTLFRIPHGRNHTELPSKPRPVVFFMHGVDSSAICWLSNLPHQDAAYIYADEGFDVWLGNFRGNMYSRMHANLTAKNEKFWEFSMNELSHIDLPTMIDYILQHTNSDFLYYIGHSMGTANAFSLLSTDKVYNKKVRKMYALAPITSVKHFRGFNKFMTTLGRPFLWTRPNNNFVPFYAVAAHPGKAGEYEASKWLIKFAFGEKAPGEGSRLPHLLFLAQGRDKGDINMTRMPVYQQFLPAGTSVWVRKQFVQRHRTRRFQKYDYGTKLNKVKYNQKEPPVYNISQIETPVIVFYGGNDYMASPVDALEIIHQLAYTKAFPLPNYNHMTFTWGMHAAQDIYWPIYKDIEHDFHTGNNQKLDHLFHQTDMHYSDSKTKDENELKTISGKQSKKTSSIQTKLMKPFKSIGGRFL